MRPERVHDSLVYIDLTSNQTDGMDAWRLPRDWLNICDKRVARPSVFVAGTSCFYVMIVAYLSRVQGKPALEKERTAYMTFPRRLEPLTLY
jgi:hypothetical protein